MFILDSLMISGIRWVLETTLTAAEAEMNDDSVLREQLLETEMRREMGEISEEEFREIESDLLARIREIKTRREGGDGPIETAAQPIETTGDSQFQVEASVSGDFHEPVDALNRSERSDRSNRSERSSGSNRSSRSGSRTTRTTRTTRTNRTRQ
ncbi:MAG TPA: gas vesicle protein GvpG [Vicinamibacterales bacterium]|nr:gas vesicle protein GvpG [Vicinamibacterales bacterium]